MPDLTPQEPDRVQQNSSKTPQEWAAAIRAEMDRQEALAQAATPGPWEWDEHFRNDGHVVMADGLRRAHLPKSVPQHAENAVHIATHDPKRVLARIADDWQRVERDLATLDNHQWDGGMCERCMWGKDPCPDTSRALDSLRGLYEALGLIDA